MATAAAVVMHCWAILRGVRSRSVYVVNEATIAVAFAWKEFGVSLTYKQREDESRPVKDLDTRLGWDDEQLTIWGR